MSESVGIIPRLIVLSYFVVTILWVYFGMKKEFVNKNAPSKHFWHDLRLWTLLAMIPYMLIYALL